MKTIVYIHGLNSTGLSFKYIQAMLPEHKAICIRYNSHQSLATSIDEVAMQLPKTGHFSIVAHSLGGIIGLILCEVPEYKKRIDRIVTISAPLGGSKAANILKWMPGHPPVIEDLTPNAAYINLLRFVETEIPVLGIISIGGHINSTSEPNDSVVTIASQRAFKFFWEAEINANHFEVLMHDKTLELVKAHIFGSVLK